MVIWIEPSSTLWKEPEVSHRRLKRTIRLAVKGGFTSTCVLVNWTRFTLSSERRPYFKRAIYHRACRYPSTISKSILQSMLSIKFQLIRRIFRNSRRDLVKYFIILSANSLITRVTWRYSCVHKLMAVYYMSRGTRSFRSHTHPPRITCFSVHKWSRECRTIEYPSNFFKTEISRKLVHNIHFSC